MPDISMCLNAACLKASECYRFRAVPTPGWQTVADFKPNEKGDCRYFSKVEPSDRLTPWEPTLPAEPEAQEKTDAD